MITKLRIKNFKCLADTGEMDIRPLTFLMGPNSSGKTSLLQALLMIRQTVDSRDMTNPLVIDGDYVKLGSYRELIFRHDLSNRLALTVTFRPDASFDRLLVGREPPRSLRLREIDVRAEFSYNRKTTRVLCEETAFASVPSSFLFLRSRTKGVRYLTAVESLLQSATGKTTFSLEGSSKFYDLGLTPWMRASPTRGWWEESWASTASRDWPAAVEVTFSRLFYIGPLRESPQRIYTATSERPQDVGLRGEAAAAVLWAARADKPARERLISKLKEWMRKFGIAADVKLKRIEASYFALLITDPYMEEEMAIPDIGFGASQILPIIVEGFYSPRNSTLLIEQPEIHLHPRAQAELGDLLVDISGDNKTLIVETHSEHLISRIQRRIAEGSLTRDNVAIYYFQPTPEGTKISPIPLNDLGQFEGEGLPEGFFDEGYKESMRFAEAISERVRG